MVHRSSVDGFQVFCGVLAVVTAPFMLATGEPAGWSFLLLAGGIIVLGALALIVFEVDYEIAGPRHVAAFGVAALFLAIAVIYLTRAANDLPTLFPGHDGDSEHFRVLPGLVALAVGLTVFVRAVGRAHPKRSHS
jgi:hypothetical protein